MDAPYLFFKKETETQVVLHPGFQFMDSLFITILHEIEICKE